MAPYRPMCPYGPILIGYDVSLNGVHVGLGGVSAQVQCKNDAYCKALVKAGVTEETINAWSVDPQVKLETGEG